MVERAVINLAERKQARLLANRGVSEPLAMLVPDFIDPPTILKMSDEAIDQMLNLIRINRMSAQLIYEKSVAERGKINDAKLQVKMDKKAEQVFVELERVFKYFDKLELRINELRALRLQVGLDFNPEGVEDDEARNDQETETNTD